jgi:serine/threonine-protein kinase SRK2
MAGLDPLAGHPKYRKIRDLGEGSYGFVQLARDMQANQDVAIKFWQRGSVSHPPQSSL